jgi:hypothetical protein
MNRIHNTLPDNKVTNLQLFILDPLSVIIKLAILSNKVVGTKICIDNNIIYLQEPGPFQAICRYFYNSNKTDMQYLYNPIELACQCYLTKTVIQQNPKMKELFKCAQNGILKLIETYKNVSIMRLCLNYYYTIISNHIEDKFNDALFRQDNMTPFYTKELTDKCNKIWSQEKIKIVLNLTTYLSTNENAETDVKSLETIMNGIDKQVQSILI